MLVKTTPINIIWIITILYYTCTLTNAHEFWIEPKQFILKNTEKISAELLVGQMMKGVSYGYYPKNFRRFEIKSHNEITPVTGQVGSVPAVQIPPQGDQLVTIIYETKDSKVSYNDWSMFEKFLQEKSLTSVREQHLKSNLPKTKFTEIYSRYAKALIGSGASKGNDQKIGLEVEIVVGGNPYIDDLSNGLTVELFYKGLPKPNTQIEIFSRTKEMLVSRKTMLTNEFGKIKLKVWPETVYMLNSVIMRRPQEDASNLKIKKPILWESLWASISFEVP